MNNDLLKRNARRVKRALRVRKHVRGSAVKPRLSVLKSNRHISAQLIDDDLGITLASAGTVQHEKKKSKASAREIGTMIANLAKEKQIKTIVFDRGRYKFHGLIAELASAAREAGLQF